MNSVTREDVAVRLGEIIRKYRKKEKMSQKTLARICGMSESQIQGYEGGHRIPDLYRIFILADRLCVKAVDIIDDMY